MNVIINNNNALTRKLNKLYISEVGTKPVVLCIDLYPKSSSQFQKGWWPLV